MLFEVSFVLDFVVNIYPLSWKEVYPFTRYFVSPCFFNDGYSIFSKLENFLFWVSSILANST